MSTRQKNITSMADENTVVDVRSQEAETLELGAHFLVSFAAGLLHPHKVFLGVQTTPSRIPKPLGVFI